MQALQDYPVNCPYCGETIVVLLDASAGIQSYIEDCEVCCRPIVVDVQPMPGGACRAEVRREDDA